nr:Uncharacterised protein [Raoultella sp. NCTC 9187]
MRGHGARGQTILIHLYFLALLVLVALNFYLFFTAVAIGRFWTWSHAVSLNDFSLS